MPLALFDLDGTLIDQQAAARLWAAAFIAQYPEVGLSPQEIAFALGARRPKGEVFAEIAARLESAVDPDDIWKQYRQRMPELVRCDAETLDALRSLRAAGWTLGIVTNGEVDNQEGKIRATGLSDTVDGWIVSAEAGLRKPDPEIFRTLAGRLGMPLEGWMVGDGLESDVAGGAAAGLQTIWIGSGTGSDSDPVPTAIAPDVAAAARIILEQVL